MGLFGWFGKKSTVAYEDDRIWLRRQAALEGLRRDLARRLGEDSLVLVVAHFPATLAEIEGLLESAGLEYRMLADPLTGPQLGERTDGEGTGRILLAPALALCPDAPPAGDMDRSRSVSILVAERHPLRSPDARIEGFAATVPHPTRLGFYLSLEDPVLRRFGSGWLPTVLTSLGMKEDEAISSRMVTKRLKQAQQKLERDTFRNLPAQSADEWYRLNVRDAVD